jgi:hypothetical protein
MLVSALKTKPEEADRSVPEPRCKFKSNLFVYPKWQHQFVYIQTVPFLPLESRPLLKVVCLFSANSQVDQY